MLGYNVGLFWYQAGLFWENAGLSWKKIELFWCKKVLFWDNTGLAWETTGLFGYNIILKSSLDTIQGSFERMQDFLIISKELFGYLSQALDTIHNSFETGLFRENTGLFWEDVRALSKQYKVLLIELFISSSGYNTELFREGSNSKSSLETIISKELFGYSTGLFRENTGLFWEDVRALSIQYKVLLIEFSAF